MAHHFMTSEHDSEHCDYFIRCDSGHIHNNGGDFYRRNYIKQYGSLCEQSIKLNHKFKIFVTVVSNVLQSKKPSIFCLLLYRNVLLHYNNS